MGVDLKHMARAAIATLVAVGTLAAGAAGAQAADISLYAGNPGMPGYPYKGMENVAGLGPVGGSAGNWVYCIEAGVDVGTEDGQWQTAANDKEQTAAWMIQATKDDSSDLTQAAVAYAIHEHLDEGNTQWATIKATGFDVPAGVDLVGKATELWNQATNKVVKSSGWEQVKYTKGMGQGTVQAWLKDANGNYASGVPYTVEYDDKIIKVDNPTGVTGNGPIDIGWGAVGNGETKMHVEYDAQQLAKIIPQTGQRKIRSGDPKTASTDEVQFRVVRGMQPTIVSDATGEYASGLAVNEVVRTEKGDRLADKATLGAKDLDNDGQPDWLTGTDNKNVTINAHVDVYGPYTSEQADQYRGKNTPIPADAKIVASGDVTADKPGDLHVSTKDGTLKYADGLTDATLPLGHYTFVWKLLNKNQTTIKEQTGSDIIEESKPGAGDGFPFMSDVTDAFFADREEVAPHNMQPTLKSSVTKANKDAKETVKGVDGKDRPAIQTVDGVTYREKGAPIRDTVTIDVKDANGDGKVDTYDWLHTKDARDKGAYSEDTQAPITVTGEYVATADKATYEKYLAASRKDPQTTLPKGMKVMATTSFDVTRAGDYLVSDTASDKAAGVWKAADGVDLKNIPAGYGTFRYQIRNEDQKSLAKATGVDTSKDYPFASDVDDGYFTDDETMVTRIGFELDSQASFNRIQLGETTGDKLIIRKLNQADLWPEYEHAAVVEGEEATRDKVALDFHGQLVKVSDDPEAVVDMADTIPADANVVHTSDIKGVTDWGDYSTDAYTYNEAGTYVWYWSMTPDLKSAEHLSDEAWRKLTHGLVNHRFGLAQETVRVGAKPETQCEISTKTQGTVEATDGKATIHDTAYLKCEQAATIEFELWKQNAGDTANDVHITTTVKQNAKGETEIDSHSVTIPVNAGDRYYWREVARDDTGKVIAYGAPRVSEETVTITVKPVLPKTGMALAGLGVGALVILVGAGVTLLLVNRRKTDAQKPADQPADAVNE